MLTHPILDQLAQLGLTGMAQAFAELEASGNGATLTHAEWLGLLVDREMTHRRDKRLTARLRHARLRHSAVVEDVDYRAPRGLDRTLFHKLAQGEWIDAHDNLSYAVPPASAKAGWPVPSAIRRAATIARCCITVSPSCSPIARWPAAMVAMPASCAASRVRSSDPLDAGARRDLYEILEERYGRRSTILTSQVPVDKWHEIIGHPTYADAILDRLVHNAHRIDLTGDSLRRTRPRPTAKD